MKRIRLLIGYDGSGYCGWQIQPNGPTIEGELNKALTGLLKEDIQVIGASRTDSGVHAMENVAVFDTTHRMQADKICFALNQRLPEDIRVHKSEEVETTWHPRKCNCRKTYEYQIVNQKTEIPVYRLYSHFYYLPLDVVAMKAAAAFFVGEHDFKSFCTIRTQAEETVRTIYSLEVIQIDGLIRIRICGNGFLYNMVRIIVGTLLKVGCGRLAPEKVRDILEARNRQRAGPTAPAKGLMLVRLEYETELPMWQKGENEAYQYHVLQSHISDSGVAFFVIKRCKEEEWDGLLRRTIHHGMQNGASLVYLMDLEANRLKMGDCYGYYTVDQPQIETIKETMLCLSQEEKLELTMGELVALPNWYCVKASPKKNNHL